MQGYYRGDAVVVQGKAEAVQGWCRGGAGAVQVSYPNGHSASAEGRHGRQLLGGPGGELRFCMEGEGREGTGSESGPRTPNPTAAMVPDNQEVGYKGGNSSASCLPTRHSV